jgi:flagellar motor switch/type III secretory pathway protein FliN
MSAWEAGSLKIGDVVLSRSAAGTPGTLALNGEFLAQASVVVEGAPEGAPKSGPNGIYFAALLESLEPIEATEPVADAGLGGRSLSVFGTLPFEIELARAALSPGELKGAGKGCLVEMDTPFEEPARVTLNIAGSEAARGTVVIRGEYFGLRVTELLLEPFRAEEPEYSGAILSASQAAACKDYDFRRPDAVTRATIKAVTDIHVRVSRALSDRFPGLSGYHVAQVDQMTAGEWIAEQKPAGRKAFIANGKPRGRSYERESRDELPPRFIQGRLHPEQRSEKQRRDLEAYLRSIRAREASGPVGILLPAQEAAEAESVFALARSSWNRIIDTAFSSVQATDSFIGPDAGKSSFVENEMVATVKLSKAGSPDIDFAYSLRALDGRFEALDRYGRSFVE